MSFHGAVSVPSRTRPSHHFTTNLASRSLNYAYGNLKRAQSIKYAKYFYHKARSILEDDTPFHLLLAASLYKLACLNDEEGDTKAA